MKEIKFRAWDKDNNKWYFKSKDIFNMEDLIGTMVIGWDSYELMQYTGLKDKRGTEIYEGDVLEYAGDTIVEVRWWGEGFYPKHSLYPESVVIGNIYENPELLKESV